MDTHTIGQELIMEVETTRAHEGVFEISFSEKREILPELAYEEKMLFLEIYQALVGKNALSLLWMKKNLEEQSAKLRHVHPLSTLLFIKETPLMQYYLRELKQKRIVTEPWNRSCYDFCKKMSEHKKNHTLYLESFLEKIEEEQRASASFLIQENRFVELLEFFL
jgi:hypothetical protein